MPMNLEKDAREEQKRLRLVEIVGPAGAGKTSLCKVLNSYRGIHLSNFPDVRETRSAPFFILYGFLVFPIYLQMFRSANRKLTRREFAWLSILSGWPNILQNELKRNEDVIILDQGPVYLLSEMSVLDPGFLKSEWAERIWQTWFSQWAATLDGIVWLDATDDRLINRIRGREKDHVMKEASPQEVIKFLKNYRNVYEHTLSSLLENRVDLKILRFDTDCQVPEEIANQLLVDFDLKAAARVDRK